MKETGLETLKVLESFSNRWNCLYVNVQDFRGNTALHYAAIIDNLKFVDYLVYNLNADPLIVNKNNERPIDLC